MRPYAPQDRKAVLTLAADTAFFGAPVEAFLDDRALFCAAFAAYYTDYEPGLLWVAEIDRAVVGYVMGCGDSYRQTQVHAMRVLPAVLWGILRGRYRLGRKTRRYILRMAQERMERAVPVVPLECFPAHLHINVARQARGLGIGRALLETCLVQFWATGMGGIHLVTTDHNRAACRLYESLGFRLLDARQTRLWRGLIAGDVQNRAYGMRPDWWKRETRCSDVPVELGAPTGQIHEVRARC